MTEPNRQSGENEERIIEIEIERLRPFKEHPFQVKDDKEMFLLQESIEKYGILNPLIVRPVPDGYYEIISGHRRKHAAKKLGYRKVPVIIRVLSEDDSILNAMINYFEEYDETDPVSIETYAKRLIGKTFADVCKQDDITKAMVVREATNYEVKHENKKRKGGLGELIEERFFHYQTNNDARPDFDKAGVELKVTPYKQNKNGTLVAKERLILTMIDYFAVVDETFEDSHMWKKAQLILLVYYLYQQELKNRLEYRIGYVKLFSPPEQDIKIIKHDFKVIVEKIKNGKAHELSEGDTLYLGAAPKAATSKNIRLHKK